MQQPLIEVDPSATDLQHEVPDYAAEYVADIARPRHRGHHLARDLRLTEAREVLRRVTPPGSPALMELGLIALQDQQLTQAEECFARVLQEQPDNAAARHNLFWIRLSLGNPAAAWPLLPDFIRDAASPEEQRLLKQLQIVMKGSSAAGPPSPISWTCTATLGASGAA